MKKVNLNEKFALFQEQWTPKLLGELNGQAVKIAKVEGEFVWHSHEEEDELFFVVKGQLTLRLRDQDIHLSEGEFFIVPKGVEHQPVASEEAWILLFEPMATKHTGTINSPLTVTDCERL